MSKIKFNKDFTIAYITKEFKEKMHVFGSDEFNEMQKLRELCPNITIRVRKTNTAPNYNLTYANMEAYIKTKPNAEALLTEFKRIKGEAVVQRNRHLYVVNWFKAKFPNYAEVEMFQKEEAKKNNANITPIAAAANDEEEMGS